LIAVLATVFFAIKARVGPVSDAIGIAVVGADAQPIVLSKYTPFEWDELYVFGPYNDKQQVCGTLSLGRVQCMLQLEEDFLNDGVQSLVFRLRGEVVHSELHARWHGDFYPTPPNQPLTPLTAVFEVTTMGVSTTGNPWRVLRLRAATHDRAGLSAKRSTVGML
jgi:hypothetical protein